MAYLRKPTADPGQVPELKLAEGDLFWGRWPAVVEHLTQTVWEDGSPRELSSVTLFVEGPVVKACLSSKATGEVVFVSGNSCEAALDALEAGLEGGGLDWRSNRKTRR